MIRVEEFLIEKLVSNKIISEEEIQIHKFGMECLLLKLIHCISYLCIAICMNMLLEFLVIGFVLVALRRNAGGYHAKTKLRCYLFSCFYVFMILLLVKMTMNHFLWWGVFALSDIIIFFRSPVDNGNKRLDQTEYQHFRKKSRKILICVNMSCLLFILVHLYDIGNLFRCSVCAEALLMILPEKRPFKINFLS